MSDHLTTLHGRRRRRRAAAAGLVLAAGLLLGPLTATAGAQTSGGVAAQAPEPVCPAAAGNARFVRFIYLNILFRCPDAAGLTYWTDGLDDGLSRGQMAQTIDLSDENMVNNNVVPLYADVLGRAPSAQELQDGVASIRAHQSDARLIAHLASSDAFYATIDPGTQDRDATWLTVAYENILDRSPDRAGQTYFLGVMGTPSTAATREKVARALELSAENDQGWTAAVFFAGLNRPPDPAGFGYWTTWLAGPGERRTFKMWTSILSSNEGYARAQTQPNPEGPPEEGGSTPEGATNKIAITG